MFLLLCLMIRFIHHHLFTGSCPLIELLRRWAGEIHVPVVLTDTRPLYISAHADDIMVSLLRTLTYMIRYDLNFVRLW